VNGVTFASVQSLAGATALTGSGKVIFGSASSGTCPRR
jgi:hypothetical protein